MIEEKITVKGIINQWIVDFLLNLSNRKIKRIDSRRFWPILVIIIITAVTITHEATYAGSFESNGFAFIGWPYAIAINIAIIIGESFTKWATTRKAAWMTFLLATFGSGALNIAYIKPWEYVGWNEIFAWIYALLPTMLIVFLGFLASNVAKLAHSQEASWEKKDNKESHKYQCFCGESFAKSIQLAGHTKSHINELKRENVENGVQGLLYLKSIYPNANNILTLEQTNAWVNGLKK